MSARRPGGPVVGRAAGGRRPPARRPGPPSRPTSLLDAVKSGSVDRVRTLLRPGVDVNAPQGDGATALHWAAHRNDVATADLLLRAGANVNAANQLGATAIWLAAVNGSAPMIRRLLEAGANPNVALESGETPLMAAARGGSVEAVQLLVGGGANVNASERLRGQTALMWAVEQRHVAVVRSAPRARRRRARALRRVAAAREHRRQHQPVRRLRDAAWRLHPAALCGTAGRCRHGARPAGRRRGRQ